MKQSNIYLFLKKEGKKEYQGELLDLDNDEFRLLWELWTDTCHMNKTIHTLTAVAIIIELSRRGAGR